MKQRLRVPKGRALADFLPTITIKAKDFANEITNFSIKRDYLHTEAQITREHIKNNREIRKLLRPPQDQARRAAAGRGREENRTPPLDRREKTAAGGQTAGSSGSGPEISL